MPVRNLLQRQGGPDRTKSAWFRDPALVPSPPCHWCFPLAIELTSLIADRLKLLRAHQAHVGVEGIGAPELLCAAALV
jgi:hypothetical protein